MQQLVFASANKGKIKELHELLDPLGYAVLSQSQFDIQSVDETAFTFIENALLKARHATRISGLSAIADDSGLEVDFLNGAPGLYSARHAQRAGQGNGDQANYEYLLRQMDGLVAEQRTARFRSVMVYLKHEFDPSPIITMGTWEGRILTNPEGQKGFGYDPVFCSDDTMVAAALLDSATKNKLSHRGKAVALMVKQLASQNSQSR